MQIALTKKLADAMKITLQSPSKEINPLFTWTANWVKVWDNRRVEDMLVMVNNSTRFAVAVYQVKRKDLKNIEKIIKEAIANTLLTMNVNPEIVEAYLEQAGEFVFTKNSDRKATAWLNQAANQSTFEVYKQYNKGEKVFDDTIGSSSNYGLVNSSKSFDDGFYPYERMFEELSVLTGKPIYQYRAYELLVTLDLDIYTASRRLIVPADIKFTDLHRVLQSTFAWNNSHLHDFSFYEEKSEFIRPLVTLVNSQESLEYDDTAVLIENQRLSDFITKFKHLVYTYDFGDNWRHNIQLIREIEAYDQQSPYLLEAEGQTPPEDVGGVSGFIEFREIMMKPDHPEYQDFLRWAGYWRPELSEWRAQPQFIIK